MGKGSCRCRSKAVNIPKPNYSRMLNAYPSWPLKYCHTTFSDHRATSSSLLKLEGVLEVKQSGHEPYWQAWPARCSEPGAGDLQARAEEITAGYRLASAVLACKDRARADSICAHGIRFANTASGCCRSIIWSSLARKKSSVGICDAPISLRFQ
jgi:hypothetical protein